MLCAGNKQSTMTSFTSNYETIKETSLKDKSVDLALISGDMTTPNQGKSQSTFLQTVCSNKFFVTLVAVVLATGIKAYTATPVPASTQFHLGDYSAIVDGSKGGVITSGDVFELGNGGQCCGPCCGCAPDMIPTPSPKKF